MRWTDMQTSKLSAAFYSKKNTAGAKLYIMQNKMVVGIAARKKMKNDDGKN